MIFGRFQFRYDSSSHFVKKKSFFGPSRRSIPFEASFVLFSFFVCFFLFLFSFSFSWILFFLFFPCFFFSILYFLFSSIVSVFNCFFRSRCSMEMWCPDEIGRDSWDWVEPPAWGRARFNSPEWGGGSSPVKMKPLQIVLLLLLFVRTVRA